MSVSFLHDRADFADLIKIVADELGIDPVIVEKDYWLMHVLWGLQQQGFTFQMKGGTSLSKGYGIIQRFSEDIDILIEPSASYDGTVNMTSQKPNAVQSRRDFYDWLADIIQIPGIVRVERDTEFDDPQYYRSGGIRLYYISHFGALPGVKDGILLEAGFSRVAPNEPKTISSWAFERAATTEGIVIVDNRAVNVPCYHPGYTFVEKIQTIIRHHRQEADNSAMKRKNFMRQYYDVYNLLQNPAVKAFIGTKAYQEHKAAWIKGADAAIPVHEHPAFLLQGEQLQDYERRYQSTAALYFQGQPDFKTIITTIQDHLPNL
jgi:hypothetical protein